MFPFKIAKQLPVYFYGSVKFGNLSGTILIDAPIKRGMIGFGQQYEMNTVSKGIAEIVLNGEVVFKGYAQFGKDYFFFVDKGAFCEFGNMTGIASNGKFICTNRIKLGEYARMGSEVEIIDTNFHRMLNIKTGEHYPMSYPIEIGSYNYVSTKVSINAKTKTPNFCTIASNSLCNKDYSSLGEKVVIGGIPAKLLKENICRDWKGEQEMMEKLKIN